MITRTKSNNAVNDYFEWLCDLVCGKKTPSVSHRKLLMRLHSTHFIYSIARDRDRASDGIALRERFTADKPDTQDLLDSWLGGCTVLEMMIALAVRCEEAIMLSARAGDRTGQWFWNMIVSLGLGCQTDDRFDRQIVDDVIDVFLTRRYAPNGCGGLFTLEHPDHNLQDVEIWMQMCWYLDEIDE